MPRQALSAAALDRNVDLFGAGRLRGVKVRSTTEPVITGARTANPFSLPARSGRTSPTALAAPVVVGIRFCAAARATQVLVGMSWSRWSEV